MRNAYLRLEDDPRTGRRHPILDGLDDAPRIIHGTYRLDVAPSREFPNMPLTLIPSYPDLPMEKVYPRVPRTEVSELYLREVGRGRVIYFPWDIDRVFWEVLAVDHGTLLRNAVQLGDGRGAARSGLRLRDPRRDCLEAGGLDDRAPGQPDQPHDDEGPISRAHPYRRAAGRRPAAGGNDCTQESTCSSRNETSPSSRTARGSPSRCPPSAIMKSWRSITEDQRLAPASRQGDGAGLLRKTRARGEARMAPPAASSPRE